MPAEKNQAPRRASAREDATVSEIVEPVVALKQMTSGGEVVEDYGHVGLTLRSHPLAFLRTDFSRRRIVTCGEAMQARDGKWLEAAGLVLVRQRPGSAKGVMLITLEGETGIANLIVWLKVFEKYVISVSAAVAKANTHILCIDLIAGLATKNSRHKLIYCKIKNTYVWSECLAKEDEPNLSFGIFRKSAFSGNGEIWPEPR